MRDKLRRKKRRTKKNQHIIVIFCIATNFAFHRTNIENVENDDFENDDPDQHIFFNDWYISEKRGKNLVARSFLMMDNDSFLSTCHCLILGSSPLIFNLMLRLMRQKRHSSVWLWN